MVSHGGCKMYKKMTIAILKKTDQLKKKNETP